MTGHPPISATELDRIERRGPAGRSGVGPLQQPLADQAAHQHQPAALV